MCIPMIDDNDTPGDSAPREVPAFLRRKPDAAVFGWFSNRTLTIIKGEEIIELSPDDVRALAQFTARCTVQGQPL